MLRLDDRLEQIAQLVRPGRRVVDVGADHGFLIASLVQRGISPGGMACDINEMPLEKSRTTVAEAGLSEKISCRLTDGLAGVAPEEGDDIVIAGMGGDLIARIVLETPWLRSQSKHLILQPMTKADHLRVALAAEGFSTQREMAVCSDAFVYTVLSVVYTGAPRELSPLEEQIGKVVEGSSPHTAHYLERVVRNLQKKAEGLEQSAGAEQARAAEYRRMVAEIEHIKEAWEDDYSC